MIAASGVRSSCETVETRLDLHAIQLAVGGDIVEEDTASNGESIFIIYIKYFKPQVKSSIIMIQ